MHIRPLADDFWNIRADFRIGGVLNIGTHASLVRRPDGSYLFLDALSLAGEVLDEVMSITADGRDLDAVINLHPFHTVHVAPMHNRFPDARWFGTRRHRDRFPDLPWQDTLTEAPEFGEEFADSLSFSVPPGVDFVPDNPNLHFASVLALHRPSGTIHVDDTLSYLRLPKLAGLVGAPRGLLVFHPTLARTLQRRAGAVDAFRGWAEELIDDWGSARTLCAAHNGVLTAGEEPGATMADRLRIALDKVDRVLSRHRARHG